MDKCEIESMAAVRTMTVDDIAYIAKIEKDCFSIPWSEQAFEESLRLPHAHFLVVECQGKLAGYVGMYKTVDEGDITNIAVSPQFRRLGMAEKLLDRLIEMSMELAITRINLEVRESNSPAIALYEKKGFTNLGIRKNFYEKPTENAIIMAKYLS